MKGSLKAGGVFLFILPHEIKWHRFEMDERTSLSKPRVPGFQLSGWRPPGVLRRVGELGWEAGSTGSDEARALGPPASVRASGSASVARRRDHIFPGASNSEAPRISRLPGVS